MTCGGHVPPSHVHARLAHADARFAEHREVHGIGDETHPVSGFMQSPANRGSLSVAMVTAGRSRTSLKWPPAGLGHQQRPEASST